MFYYLGREHVNILTRAVPALLLERPLATYWFLPLPLQSVLRFRMMSTTGLPVDRVRKINDGGKLNTGDKRENKYKTEGRAIHNAKLEFLLIVNEATRMNLNLAYIYSRTADSAYLCGKVYSWGQDHGQGHCDSKPFTQADLGVLFADQEIVFCDRCNKNYTEIDLYFVTKSTAVLLASGGLLHAKLTAKMTVSELCNLEYTNCVVY